VAERIPDAKHICLVGHAPSLAERARQLLGITATEALKMPKGALAAWNRKSPHGSLEVFRYTPNSSVRGRIRGCTSP